MHTAELMQLASPRHFNSNEDNLHHNEVRNVEMMIWVDMIVDCEGVLFIAQTGVTYPVVFGKFSGAKMASLARGVFTSCQNEGRGLR